MVGGSLFDFGLTFADAANTAACCSGVSLGFCGSHTLFARTLGSAFAKSLEDPRGVGNAFFPFVFADVFGEGTFAFVVFGVGNAIFATLVASASSLGVADPPTAKSKGTNSLSPGSAFTTATDGFALDAAMSAAIMSSPSPLNVPFVDVIASVCAQLRASRSTSIPPSLVFRN